MSGDGVTTVTGIVIFTKIKMKKRDGRLTDSQIKGIYFIVMRVEQVTKN